MKKFLKVSLIIILLLAAAGAWFYHYSTQSNSWNAQNIGDIPTPLGYERVTGDAYAGFLRSLPLKPSGSKVKLYTGGNANLQFLSTAVVDMPMLSNSEQCADMTMRLRAEYLFSQGCYSQIAFTDVNGKRLRYSGGSSRTAFEAFIRRAYGVCSTFSVYHETEPRRASDVQPGDVLVYPARQGHRYGHAILVADVAVNKKGEKAILCVEGNTPAREAHVTRNPNPLNNPWTFISDSDNSFFVSLFRFNKNELRHYPEF